MEMRLAPILILYYFPAEFSRHLYDNAKKIFPSPQKNPSGVAATPRPRIILPPPRSITLASLPNRAHSLPLPPLSLLSNTRRRYRASISFLLLPLPLNFLRRTTNHRNR